MKTAVLSLLLFVVCVTSPRAHDDAQWIQDGLFRSPMDGSSCCGVMDCTVVDVQYLWIRNDGYHLVDNGDFIPFEKALPSTDNRYWRCGRPWRCFFVPIPKGS